jgi:hypothetical protein
MALRDWPIAPGILTTKTDRGAAGRWKSGDKVRFHQGNAQKLGGWQKNTANTILGLVRGAADWQSIAFQHLIGAGSHLKLYIYSGGTFSDITPLRSSGTLANNPFTTVNLSTTVTVHHVGHGLFVSDFVRYSGATAVAGITVDGQYQVASVVDADNYTIVHSAAANASLTGGGATVAFSYEIHVGAADSTYGLGWGAGPWSLSTWGTPRVLSNFLTKARTWKLDNWGEDLIANPRGGGIYLWDTSVGTSTRAAAIAGAPSTAKGIFVSPEQRILVAYGANDGANDDPMLVRWSDAENYNTWTPNVITNVAGSKRLDKGSELLTHLKTRLGTLIFSDAFHWLMTFDGPPNTFGWIQLGSNGGLQGPNASVEAGGIGYWMGQKNFYIYDGSTRVLECDVWPSVFENLNAVQRDKVFAGSNQFFSEIWWLYPSKNATECDSYVAYNYVERHWTIGTLARTLFVGDSKIFTNPYAFGADGYLYDHEAGVDADGVAMHSTLDSGDIELSEGDQMMRIRRFVPDFKLLAGSISITFKGTEVPAAHAAAYEPQLRRHADHRADQPAAARAPGVHLARLERARRRLARRHLPHRPQTLGEAVNVDLPDVGEDAPVEPRVLRVWRERLVSALKRSFPQGGELVIGNGQKIRAHFSQTYNLNFAAPAAVPGKTDQTVTLTGARIGDTVVVAAPLAVGANFAPPMGFVAANDQVTIRWWQLTGAAADPDGAGGFYRVDLWRH